MPNQADCTKLLRWGLKTIFGRTELEGAILGLSWLSRKTVACHVQLSDHRSQPECRVKLKLSSLVDIFHALQVLPVWIGIIRRLIHIFGSLKRWQGTENHKSLREDLKARNEVQASSRPDFKSIQDISILCASNVETNVCVCLIAGSLSLQLSLSENNFNVWFRTLMRQKYLTSAGTELSIRIVQPSQPGGALF